ncbi:DUF2681 domain-containing protein [Mediterraneibacter sp. NSJ-151]|uniref:glucosaminidase domain-containing protein n=1 Tax=Mediterraneibacter sp. NSJ-151 TaxID=2897708 RepID=UPI001F0A7797|nr:glucosaminidase domain-containing protein [Mediterraneibacter sp. NSJ-151]MCH4280497.1 DUF2681 domain-containing protein [Mediterraneibacter sp. NSJ-151]
MHLEWNKLKTPGYLEIGLAVILIITMAGIGGWKQHQNKVLEKEKEIIRQAEEENKKAKDKQQNANNKTESVSENDVQETIAEGQYPIMGTSPVTAEQLVSYFKSAGVSYPSEELGEGGADSIETFATMYCEEAAAEGVRPEVAFVQTMKETGWLQFGGDVSVNQFNFAGLGTTGGGVPGNSYPDVRTGIRAQIQHLKAYASTEPLNQACVDERYEYVLKGCAPYVEWLGQKENPAGTGWATAEKYGYSIVSMIGKM